MLHPVDPRDERATIRIGRWPKEELERQERNQQARLTEHDADEYFARVTHAGESLGPAPLRAGGPGGQLRGPPFLSRGSRRL